MMVPDTGDVLSSSKASFRLILLLEAGVGGAGGGGDCEAVGGPGDLQG